MRHEQFRRYLEGGEIVEAHAAKVEQALGFDLDNADLSDQGVSALIARLHGEHPGLAGPESGAALRAYSQFLEYYRAR